jgi:hypothetical protein
MLSQNHSPELNPHILTFLHPIVLCRITYHACLTTHRMLFNKNSCDTHQVSRRKKKINQGGCFEKQCNFHSSKNIIIPTLDCITFFFEMLHPS